MEGDQKKLCIQSRCLRRLTALDPRKKVSAFMTHLQVPDLTCHFLWLDHPLNQRPRTILGKEARFDV